MNNKEAIERVTIIKTYGGMTIPVAMRDIEALDMAIKALEKADSSGNCVLTIFGDCSYNKTGCSDCEVKNKIRKALEERPTGEWNKWEDERWGGVWHYCSNCHNDALYKQVDGIFKQILSDFCPNCGAKMKGEEE